MLSLLLSTLLACDGEPTTEVEPAPPPPAPAPEPAPPPPAPAPAPEVAPAAAAGPITFTPDPICQGGKPVTLHPPCPGELGEDALLLEPGQRVGLVHGGQAIGPEALCRYGYAATIGTEQLAWWGAERFSSLEDAKGQISAALTEACEPFPWYSGLISLEEGVPVGVTLADGRFRTRSGIQVGQTTLAEAEALLPNSTRQEMDLDGSVWLTTDLLTVTVFEADQPVGELRAPLTAASTPSRSKAKLKAKVPAQH